MGALLAPSARKAPTSRAASRGSTVALMSEQREKADDIEQRYVAEHAETEEMLEGLDPEQPRKDQTVDQVAGVSDESDDHVEKMARDDP